MERGRFIVLGVALAAMLGSTGLVRAQAPTLAEQQARLKAASDASAAAQARSQALERAAANERDEAARARAGEAAIAQRIVAASADIAAAQARIAIVDRLMRAQRQRLFERQETITRLVAALQSLARRPAVLGLVQPGSTEDIVHVRAVLGTTMKVVEARSADVRAELTRIRQLRAGAVAAVASLREGKQRIERERIALVQMEAAHRLRSRDLDRSALVESDKAIALGEQARNLVDSMETITADSETRGTLAALPGPLPRPGDTAASTGAQRAAAYRLPVPGAVATGFGELSDTGVRSRGLTLVTRGEAPVVAPAAGRAVFAGHFRDYGMIVILDHGQGWTSLVAGLGSIAVRAGANLPQGAAIGRAGGGDAPRVTVELRRRGQPIDLTALLG